MLPLKKQPRRVALITIYAILPLLGGVDVLLIDLAISNAVLKCTNNYHDTMTIDAVSGDVLLINSMFQTLKVVHTKIDHEDAIEAVNRLIESGKLRIDLKWDGGFSFCMTSLLKHRKLVLLEVFTRRFLFGFISGIITGVTITVLGELLLACIRLRLGI